ncbi:glycoside hydrolase family 79 protein [Gelatoporia subvermispora B]|uniref:Glycoside hydrolase family 79 protein n=1 Tax=Ceriporiopsis subvermispora (strain B) TaxID=914234 RepID=M2P6W4_CERS8|nr:glycoside hydrolase family 79 protein [Gelatoporia subvermispora B]
MLPPALLALTLALAPAARAAVTVYGVQGALGATGGATPAFTSDTAAGTAVYDPPTFSGPAAFNPVILAPPPPPDLAAMPRDRGGPLSMPHAGPFLGFSIEMSVVNQVSETYLQVPFLNLMALVADRAGGVHIRVGGNSQENATMVPSLPNGAILEKTDVPGALTGTPNVAWSPELLYMLNNVSSLVGVQWYLGIPFNDTSHLRLQIAELGEAILGENVLGFQVGNEPDLYVQHGHRPPGWNETNYFHEFGIVVNAVDDDAHIPAKGNLIGPSISGPWTPEDVWNTGYIEAYAPALGALAVEHYPADNCAAAFPDAGFGIPTNPQDVFADYLNHTSAQRLVSRYLNSTNIAQKVGKPFLMFETNTASCGGFPGVSDSFGAALWGVDYALQMAYANFSGALLHVGGQNNSNNPFTPPPTRLSPFEEWTIGPIFYSALVVAEALGASDTVRVADLDLNDGNIYTPGYGIWENDNLARLVLLNFVTDPSGAHDYNVTLTLGGLDFGEPAQVPANVTVKYLTAESVSAKENVVWGGQTLGNRFQGDGTFQGDEQLVTIPCNQTAATCLIPVPAPGAALVFLSEAALSEGTPTTTQTFPTTAMTKSINTASVAASVLATSNGNSAANRGNLSSTDKGGFAHDNGANSLHHPALAATSLIALLGMSVIFVA